MIIVVEEKPHAFYKRKGDDLYCEKSIDLLTALAGGHFYLEALDEKALEVTILPGEIIKPGASWLFSCFVEQFLIPRTGAVKVIKGQGMPSHRHHELGDIYIGLTVTFPESLPETAFPMLESALPPRDQASKPAKMDVEEVFLENADPSKQRRAMDADAMDEDEDGGHGGGGVQCAQQVRSSSFLYAGCNRLSFAHSDRTRTRTLPCIPSSLLDLHNALGCRLPCPCAHSKLTRSDCEVAPVLSA